MWCHVDLKFRIAVLTTDINVLTFGLSPLSLLLFFLLLQLLFFIFIIFKISFLTLSRFFIELLINARGVHVLAVLPLLCPLIIARFGKSQLAAHNHLHFELTARVLLALSDVEFISVEKGVHCHSNKSHELGFIFLLEGLVHYLGDETREKGARFRL